ETGTPTPSASETTPEAGTPTPSASETTPEAGTPTPSASETQTGAPTPSSTPTETDEPTDPECKPLDVDIKGLNGKIAAGSGWHGFTLSVTNPSDEDYSDVLFFAGVGPNDADAEDPFKTGQVKLQGKVNGTWTTIDEDGFSSGYLDMDELKASKTVNYSMRLNVAKNAPVGEGVAVGGGVYFGDDATFECEPGYAGVVFEITGAGTNPGPSDPKPQTGGKVPAPAEKPNADNTQKVDGNLAETGSSSQLPVIGLIGGITIVAGAGVVFAMKRRKGADAAA
ncbi:LPXTG cell wall anchor domain-containing protein, partial [Streptomyces sp. T-3]|nr:LPXTG cell wall anchor domain-containing protein [Streptomyces sp. T-3]